MPPTTGLSIETDLKLWKNAAEQKRYGVL